MEPEAPWPVLSKEAISKLASGVHYCFLQWTALQLAISNEWGGRNSNQKALQLENDVVVWFAHSRVRRYIDELEELLDDVMNEQFSTQAEDDSIQEVATQLFILHEECSQGNYETVNRLAAGASQSKAASAKSVKAPNENGEESDSDDDSMDEEGPSSSGQQQDASMELDAPVAAEGSRASRQQERPSTLTQEEMADGWQEAPTRRRGRAGNRT